MFLITGFNIDTKHNNSDFLAMSLFPLAPHSFFFYLKQFPTINHTCNLLISSI